MSGPGGTKRPATRQRVLRAKRLAWRVRRILGRMLGWKRTTYIHERLAQYRSYWKNAAQALGADFEPLCRDIWEIRLRSRRTRVSHYLVPIDNPVTLRLAGNKPYCSAVAERLGLPVPPHRTFVFGEIEAAWRFMGAHQGPFVVKPASGSSSGLGVTTHVRNRRQLESAVALASLYGEELMIEAMVPMESCRLLYLEGELIHAVRRRGVRVVGDGQANVDDLLARRGLARLRSDRAVLATLEAQGLGLASRPAAGHECVVRYLPAGERVTHELRTVYNESITDRVCPGLSRAVAAVVNEIGARFAGVDILTNDPAVPLAASGGVFLELNTTPGLHHHYIGQEGPAVTLRVLRHLLQEPIHEQRSDRFPAGERRALS
ncbi:MAG TPA: hypothetical protein VFK15_00720 [Burkholderiales bacterium]|nr:hypothetical protein [Burkholderiales bacterium]